MIARLAILLLLTACESPAYRPARAAPLSPEALASLTRVVADATDQRSLRLTPEVFATSHILTLEQRIPGLPAASGTVLEKPRQFHLLSNGRHCVLSDVKARKRYRLDKLVCQPESP